MAEAETVQARKNGKKFEKRPFIGARILVDTGVRWGWGRVMGHLTLTKKAGRSAGAPFLVTVKRWNPGRAQGRRGKEIVNQLSKRDLIALFTKYAR